MSRVRINDLARELEVKSKAILDALTVVGVTEKKTHSSSLEADEAERVRKHLTGQGVGGGEKRAAKADDIKPKFDFSKISKPGDVSKALKKTADAPAAKVAPAAKAAAPAAVPLKPAVATPVKPAVAIPRSAVIAAPPKPR